MTYTIYQKQFRAISGNNCHYGRITNCFDNKTFSWVYDCGQNDFISQMPDNGKVDLIVLSHFDSDHVGGAWDLIQRNKQRPPLLIAPYLDDDTKILVLSENAVSYLDNEISIEFIERLFTQNDDDNFIFVGEEISEDKLKPVNLRIKSCCGADFWTFHPLQYLDPTLKQFQFVSDGIKKVFNWQTSSEAIEKILDQLNNNRKTFAAKLNDEYKKLIHQVFTPKNHPVTANSISVCLYSGPVASFKDDAVGWLHTGDTVLKRQNLFDTFKKAFARYKDNIGVISLPHHGAISCHNPDLFYEWPFAVYVLTDHPAKRADFSIDPLFLLHNRDYTICERIEYVDKPKKFFISGIQCCKDNVCYLFEPFSPHHFPFRFVYKECDECLKTNINV